MKALPGLKDTARIECLHNIGVYHLMNFHEDSSARYINLIEKESQQLNYAHGMARACMQKSAFANHFRRNYFEMEQMAKAAMNWFEKSSSKKQIEIAYWQLGYANLKQGKFDDALANFQLMRQWAKQHGNELWQWQDLEPTTDIYRERGEYVKLLETQQKLIQLDRKGGDTRYYSTHELWVLGLMYKLMEEYATALPFWRKLFVEEVDGDIGAWNKMEYAELLTLSGQYDSALYYYNRFDSANADAKDLRYFLVSKGEYNLSLQQYSAALPYFEKSLPFHREFNDRTQEKRTLLDIAKTHAALRNNDSAISYARQGLAMALQMGSKPSIRDGYEILYRVYDSQHQNDSAYYYYRNYITMKETVMNDQTRGKLAAYNYEHKIESLDKEKSAQQIQLKQTAQQRTFLMIGIGCLILLGVFIIRNVLLKRKNEQNLRQLAEKELQFQKLESEKTKSAFQQKATELEMQALRAQMNPHFIFNSLNSINRFILQNNKLKASEYLTKFSRLVRLILQNSQSASIPLESEVEALSLYLELEALRFDHHFTYRISVDENIDAAMVKLPPLIIQPYAENAIWHGLMNKQEKGQLDIEITEEDSGLLCRITDDGVGRKKAAELKSKSAPLHKSMGLQITADRIAMLKVDTKAKASITINDLVLPDGNAGGTEVLLRIPSAC